jgi:glycosyltransferase involved in cell wall biosynthesis
MSKIKLLAIPSDSHGVGKFRILDPFKYIGDNFSDDIHVDIMFDAPDLDSTFDGYDIVYLHSFIHKTSHEANVKRIKWLKSKGIKVIVDIDDLWYVDQRHPMYYQVLANKMPEKKIELLKLADYVSTTTPIFAKTLKDRLNLKNIIIFPNAVNEEEEQFKINKIESDKIRFGWLGGSCMTPDTEILTDDGWKRFDQLNQNENVATLNPITNEIEYHKPKGYICEPYDGYLNCAKNGLIEYEVTPNHNMYASEAKNLTHKKLNLQLIQSANIHGKNFHVKRDGVWNGIDMKYFNLPKLNFVNEDELVAHNDYSFVDRLLSKQKKSYNYLFDKYGEDRYLDMDKWLKFFGFWMAEGWTSKTKGLHQVGVAQTKENGYLDEIYQTLVDLGFNPKYTKDKKQVRVFDKQLWYYLSEFGQAFEKYIPSEILQLSSRQLSIFLDWFIKGDGCIDNNKYKRMRGYTSSKQLADNLQEIALKIGITATITNRGKRTNEIKGRKINTQYDSLQINFGNHPQNSKHNKSTPLVKSIEQYQKYYNGNVYCVEVENHIIYVRRNGKPFWIGNSHLHDIELLEQGISSIHASYKDKVQFVLCGFDTRGTVTEIKKETGEQVQRPIQPHETVWFKYESIFTDKYRVLDQQYKTYLFNFIEVPYDDMHKPYIRRWTKNINSYATNYNFFDISLAPLVESTFNANKSQLKVIEAGFHKKAIIASETNPYTIDLVNSIENGIFNKNGNALLVSPKKNHKQWAQHMKKLIENPSMIEDMGNRLYETVKDKYSLKNVCKDRVQFFKTIINK